MIGRLAGILIIVLMLSPAFAVDALPAVSLNADEIGPRAIEELTGRNIARDYAHAWQTLAQALEQNRTDLLEGYFTGFAKDTFRRRIADQKKTGIYVRTVDRGHKMDAVFYAPNGDAMQLRDTANVEIQVFDGTKLIQQETVPVHYVVLMTPAADRWMVRLLEAVPGSQ